MSALLQRRTDQERRKTKLRYPTLTRPPCSSSPIFITDQFPEHVVKGTITNPFGTLEYLENTPPAYSSLSSKVLASLGIFPVLTRRAIHQIMCGCFIKYPFTSPGKALGCAKTYLRRYHLRKAFHDPLFIQLIKHL